MKLPNSVALVTGGGRGIGLAVACALAREGASVAVCARSEDELEAALEQLRCFDRPAIAIPADVTRRTDVDHVVAQVSKELGPVDLLLNNAGRNQAIGPLWEVDPDQWWLDVEVNLRGIMLCARSVLPGMIERRRGRIVNVSSGIGLGASPLFTSYSASKAAGVSLTDSLAHATAAHGVQVFAVSPGMVHTALSDSIEQSEIIARLPEEQKPPESLYRDPALMGALVVRIAAGEFDALSGRYFHVDDDHDALLSAAEEIRQRDLRVLRLRT